MWPTTPQAAAGMRMEPAPSVPRARGPRPAATAEAAPPLLPPEVRERSQGLGVTPKLGPSVRPLWPNSGMRVLPSMTQPAAASLVAMASSRVGTWSAKMALPWVVRMPAVSTWSLMLTGTPWSGGRGFLSMTACSAARAWCMARSWVMVTKLLRAGWAASMAARVAVASSTGESFFWRMSEAARLAERVRSSFMDSPVHAIGRW